MTSEKIGEKGFVGLPPNLLQKDEDDSPRVFALMPGLNRKRRRGLASRMRSLRSVRLLVGRMNETDTILKVFRQPGHRYSAFWIELQDGPPPADEYKTSLFVTVDYWLLRDFEAHLDKLEPPADAEMLKHCPPWDEIRESLLEQLKRIRVKPDLRYFALWPMILDEIANWQKLSEATRTKVANAAFALSSIAGNTWFVDEFQRLCSSAAPYFEGLKRQDHVAQEGKENGETDADIEVEAEPADEGDASEPSCSPFDWQALGAQLRSIGERLEAGAREPALAEALDALWAKYEALKKEQPLHVPAKDLLQSALAALEAFVVEAGQGPAAGTVDSGAVMAGWRAASDDAGSDEECERVRKDAEEALLSARDTADRLAKARAALISATSDHARLQEAERSITDRIERRRTRQSLAEIENRLPALRSQEEEAEEALIAALELRKLVRETGTRADPEAAADAGVSIDEEPAATEDLAGGGNAEPDPVATGSSIGASDAQSGEPVPTDQPVEVVSPAEEPSAAGAPMAQRVDEQPLPPVEEPGSRTEAAGAAAADEPATASPAGHSDDGFSDEAGRICRPVWHAMRCGRPGAGYFIASALQETQPDLRVPSPHLIRAVALSRHLKSPDGEIARELARVFAEIDPDSLGTGPDSWQVANNLLLAAACLRPLLLAPETGAAAAAGYVHLGEEYGALYRLRTVLTEYGSRLRASRLDAGAFRSAAPAGDWHAAMSRLAAEAVEWRQRAPSMNTLFPAATAVWRHWLKSGTGIIWRMLEPVISGDVSQIEETRQLVEQLSDHERRDLEITHTDRKELKRQKGQDISFGALEQLHGKTIAAVQLAQRWLALAKARPGQGDFVSRELSSLQRAVMPLIEAVLGEMRAADDDEWRLVSSAQRCVCDAVEAIRELFTPGAGGEEAEWPVAKALGMDLLLQYPVAVGDRWEWEASSTRLLALVDSASEEADWVSLARGRIECGDICNAFRLIDYAGSAPEAEELRRDANRAALQLRSGLRQRINKSREAVELAFSYRIIGEEERADASEIIADLERLATEETRFDRANSLLDSLESDIATKKDQRLAELSEAKERIRLQRPEANFARVDECIEVGDLASAHEWLQRVETGYSEEEEAVERDMFAEFFPGRLRTIDAAMGAVRSPDPLIKAVSSGEVFAEVPFGELPLEMRRSAAEFIKAWYLFKQDRGHPIEALERVLRGIGFARLSNVQIAAQSASRREFRFDAEPIADRSICPLPRFGSIAAGKYRLVSVPGTASEEEILAGAGAHAAGRPTIALVTGRIGEVRRRALAKLARDRREPVLVLDENLLVFLAGERRSRIAAFFHCTLPFAYAEPFVQTSGDVPPEMFYGRIDELRAVMSQQGRCLVYGGRQLGKTALLRHAERNFHQPARRHYSKWIDLRAEGVGYSVEPSEIWTVLWRKLQEIGADLSHLQEPRSAMRGRIQAFMDGLRSWLDEDGERRVLLLLDEADRFLALDARNHYQETVRLKNLMETTGRRIKVVFAGLHNVLRAAEQANHPLAHLGVPIEIGPLIKDVEWKEAGELLRRPLLSAGYELENRRLVDRVLAQTNYYPSLIQVYGSKLISHRVRSGLSSTDVKGGPRYQIRSHHLDETYQQGDLREEIKTRFHLTLQLDQRYEVVAYSVAYAVVLGQGRMEEGIPVGELRSMAYSWWEAGFRQTNEREFDTMLDEMVGLGVLRKVRNGRFALRNPNILLLMGSADDIQSMLARDRDVPEEFDPTTWRVSSRTAGDAPQRSPLTLSQVADLVRPANGVTIIAGCAAARIDDVEKYLGEQVEDGYLIRVEDMADRVRFRRTLDTIDDREGGGTTVYLVPHTVAWTTEWVEDAATKLGRLRAKDKHARVVFVADPQTLLTELRAGLGREQQAIEWMNVRPWHENFVGHWLEDHHLLRDKENRQRVLVETGYWPVLMEKWIGKQKARRPVAGPGPGGSLLPVDELKAAFGLGVAELKRTLEAMAIVASEPVNAEELLGLEQLERTEVELALDLASRLSLVSPASGGRWRIDPIVASVLAGR